MLLKQNKTYVTFLLFQTDDSGKQYERTYQKSGNTSPGMPKSYVSIPCLVASVRSRIFLLSIPVVHKPAVKEPTHDCSVTCLNTTGKLIRSFELSNHGLYCAQLWYMGNAAVSRHMTLKFTTNGKL